MKELIVPRKGIDYRVLVDDEDYPFLKRFTWHIYPRRKVFYCCTVMRFDGRSKLVGIGRLIMGMPYLYVDHRNRNPLDNQKKNLRLCSASENAMNSKKAKTNKYGYRGVGKARTGNFFCNINANGKRLKFGGFKTAEEAARKYDEISKELHGDFGIRNFAD